MKGKLIVLEGIDGSGKSTQFAMLTQALKEQGHDFRPIAFPRYSESSSAPLRAYLNGDFGKNPGDVSAHAASVLFFVDRFASWRTDWGEYYKSGGLILCDRYTTSNAIHQGAKLPPKELDSFLDWLYDFEFDLMELPRPDAVLYMDIDLESSLSQMRARRLAGGGTDIHEEDAEYLASCLRAGSAAADRLGWHRIPCIRDGVMKSPDEIHEYIMNILKETIQ